MLRKRFAFRAMSALIVCSSLAGAAPAYAADLAVNDRAEVTNVDNENKDSDIIIDSKLKEFANLDKVRKYLGFDYKLPDYAVDGYKVDLIRVCNPGDGNDSLEIYFKNSDKEFYPLNIFKNDPVELLTKDFEEGYGKPEVTSTAKNIKGINGLCITLNHLADEDGSNGYGEKYFVWQNDGIWYGVNYGNELMSDDVIVKIADSLKKPEDLTNLKYVIDEDEHDYLKTSIQIYDKEDLDKVKEVLGYSPKLPLQINDNIKVSHADLDNDDGKILFSYYSYDKGTVVYIQSKDSDYGYEDIAASGYVKDNMLNSKIKADKLSINGVDVFRHIDDGDNKIIYHWKENDIYYFFEVYYQDQIENADDIVEQFIKAQN